MRMFVHTLSQSHAYPGLQLVDLDDAREPTELHSTTLVLEPGQIVALSDSVDLSRLPATLREVPDETEFDFVARFASEAAVSPSEALEAAERGEVAAEAVEPPESVSDAQPVEAPPGSVLTVHDSSGRLIYHGPAPLPRHLALTAEQLASGRSLSVDVATPTTKRRTRRSRRK